MFFYLYVRDSSLTLLVYPQPIEDRLPRAHTVGSDVLHYEKAQVVFSPQ